MIQFLHCLWSWLNANAGAFALVVTLATTFFLAWRYLHQRGIEIRDRRFEIYHLLIQQLVEANEGQEIKLDRQIAVVYELRNFRDYYDVTLRILRGLRETWAPKAGAARLIAEIDLTLAFIRKLKWRFC